MRLKSLLLAVCVHVDIEHLVLLSLYVASKASQALAKNNPHVCAGGPAIGGLIM